MHICDMGLFLDHVHLIFLRWKYLDKTCSSVELERPLNRTLVQLITRITNFLMNDQIVM